MPELMLLSGACKCIQNIGACWMGCLGPPLLLCAMHEQRGHFLSAVLCEHLGAGCPPSLVTCCSKVNTAARPSWASYEICCFGHVVKQCIVNLVIGQLTLYHVSPAEAIVQMDGTQCTAEGDINQDGCELSLLRRCCRLFLSFQ